jgi:hypothetical protein
VLTDPDVPRGSSGIRFGNQGVGQKGEKDGDVDHEASAARRANDSSIEFEGEYTSTSVSYGGCWGCKSRRWWYLKNKSCSLVEIGISSSWRWAESRYNEVTDMLYPMKTWGYTRTGFEGELVNDGQVYTDEEEYEEDEEDEEEDEEEDGEGDEEEDGEGDEEKNN